MSNKLDINRQTEKTLADNRLSANVTVQGNVFNGATELVQTTGAGALPAISGVNVTALNATNLGSGTVPDARFPATLPAASGTNLTALNATQLTTGSVSTKRMGNLNVFHVADYGAVGNGSTDDAAAIAAAIAAAASTFGTVMFGAKTYKITTPIAITSSTRLQGAAGNGGKTVITGSPLTQVLTVANSTDLVAENITFNCAGTNTFIAIQIGNNSNAVVFRNCNFTFTSFITAIEFGTGSNYIEFSRCSLSGSALGLGLNINSAATFVRISDMQVGPVNGLGIQLNAATAFLDDVSITTCSFDNLKITGTGTYIATGLLLKSSGGHGLNVAAAVTNSLFSGVSISNNSYGVKDAATVNTGTVYDFLTAGNLSGDSSILSTGSFFNKKNASVTLQGNTFNAASKLVQLTAANKFPALDGSLITNLPVPPSLTHPFVHIDDYGAAGDGTTNDDAAFTAALAALPSSGGTIYLGAKLYAIHSTIDLSAKGVNLIGQGGTMDVTTSGLVKTTAGAAVIVGGHSSKVTDLVIMLSDSSGIGIATNNANNSVVSVERVTVRGNNSSEIGIYCDNAPDYLRVLNCYLYGCFRGIYIQNSPISTSIEGCYVLQGTTGIKCTGQSIFVTAAMGGALVTWLEMIECTDSYFQITGNMLGATALSTGGDCSRSSVMIGGFRGGSPTLMSLNGSPDPKVLLDNAVREIFVDDYGAIGDGSTDDDAAVVRALVAAGTLKVPVVFGPKTYLCNSGNFTVPDDVVIRGSGIETTNINTPNGDCFQLGNNCEVHDLAIHAGNYGIVSSSKQRNAISGVETKTCGSIGISFIACRYVTVLNSRAISNANGVVFDNCSDVHVANVLVATNGTNGFWLANGNSRVTVTNLTASQNSSAGIYVSDSCTEVVITGVTTGNSTYGLFDDGGSHTGVAYQIISTSETAKNITSVGSVYHDLALAAPVIPTALPTVHVDDYGAVGDGGTNDSAAFNAALAAVGVNGGVVLMGLKSYALASNIDLASNTGLRGSGLDKTTLILSSSAFINIASANEVSLEDFTVTGDTTNYNVLISSGNNIKISDVRSTGNFIGFSIGATQQVLCNNVIVDTCNLGFDINNCSEVSMSNVQAKGCGTGIYLEGTTNANIRIDSITAGNTVVGVQDDCTTSNNVVIVNASYNDLVKKVINGTATYVDLNTVSAPAVSPIKAWVSFDYLSSTVNIRASYNIASVTRTAAGRYQITFTTPFADTYYGVNGTGRVNGFAARGLPDVDNEPSRTTSVSNIYVLNHVGAPSDPTSANDQINVMFFGNQ